MSKDSIIKTVSLDAHTVEIASRLPNFSHFTRECLKRWGAQYNRDSQSCIYQDSLMVYEGRCNPLNQSRPICFHCWPNGSPKKQDIGIYRENRRNKIDNPNIFDEGIDIDWLLSQCFENNKHLIQISTASAKETPTKHTEKSKSKLSKIWAIMRG